MSGFRLYNIWLMHRRYRIMRLFSAVFFPGEYAVYFRIMCYLFVFVNFICKLYMRSGNHLLYHSLTLSFLSWRHMQLGPVLIREANFANVCYGFSTPFRHSESWTLFSGNSIACAQCVCKVRSISKCMPFAILSRSAHIVCSCRLRKWISTYMVAQKSKPLSRIIIKSY